MLSLIDMVHATERTWLADQEHSARPFTPHVTARKQSLGKPESLLGFSLVSILPAQPLIREVLHLAAQSPLIWMVS